MVAHAPSLRNYTLLLLSADAPKREFGLNGSTVTFGRDRNNSICLSWDHRVSRHHARLWRAGENWILEDLGSTNGTYVGDYRLEGPVAIVPGHTFRVGRTQLELRVRETPAPPAELPPLANTRASRPGMLMQALSALGLVPGARPASREEPSARGSVVAATARLAPPQPAPSPTGHVSCTIFPQSVEIRARYLPHEVPANGQDIRAALNGLESTRYAEVRIVEPLGGGDAWLCVSATPGHQVELLTIAQQIMERLLQSGIHGDVQADPKAAQAHSVA